MTSAPDPAHEPEPAFGPDEEGELPTDLDDAATRDDWVQPPEE